MEKNTYTTWQVIKRQINILKLKRKKFIFLIMGLNTICAGLLPLIVLFIPRVVIDHITLQSSQAAILQSIIGLTIMALVCGAVVAFASAYESTFFIQIRVDEFDAFNRKYQIIDYSHLENPTFRDKAGVSTSALNGNNMGFEGIYHDLFKIVPLGLSIILFCILIGIYQPLIFIAALVGTVITAFVNKGIAQYIDKRKEDRAHTQRQKNYFYETCYDFKYAKEIRVNNLKDKLSKDYKLKSYNYLTVVKDIANRRFLLGLMELIMLLLQDGIAYYFVIKGFYAGQLTLGEVSLYIGAIIALSTTLRAFTLTLSDLVVCSKFSVDYFKFNDDQSYYSFKGNRKALPPEETLEIEFKDVWFQYPNTDKWILKEFNFTIHSGEKLAIVGTNGAGKSTIVKLICGLFEITKGTILINGINIKEFDQKEYQKMFSVVFQEVYIYAATVLENVIGTDVSLTSKQQGIECLTRVGLKTKIESLPHQYDQQLLKVIDEEGVELSGGQNQKIAIARALYKNGNMVILDEPTSALDALAEAEIYQSFNDLVQHKTAVYISHRLSSTKFCDKIALFSPDGLLEYGSHGELMKLKGHYYTMFETQGKYYQEEVKEHE